MYIGYDVKNGIKYAKICNSKRVDGKVKTTQQSLGRVIDEENGIYKNRKRGLFTYSIETGEFGQPDPALIPAASERKQEKLILDFGDAYFLDAYIKMKGLDRVIQSIGYGNMDSVWALSFFYVLCNMANCHSADWYEGSYAKIMYPKANLASQRVSDMLSAIGDERTYREFFKAYAPLLAKRDNGEDILIDSTGLPNSIRFPLTAISNHNGEISNETRLIYVVQQNSNLPLFFRYCPGNIVDVSTLTRTLMELKAYNINVSHAILDAGYLTEDNVEALYDAKVSFLSRLKQNTNLYKSAVDTYLPYLQREENFVSYNAQYAYVKRVEVDYYGHTAYVYLGLDKAMQSLESSKLFFARAKNKKMTDKDVHAAMRTQGVFALVSSRPIAHDKVLPLYYTRQQIEQIFDICKNNTNMLPLRVQKEDTFRGHLLIAFLASVIVRMLQQDIEKTAYTPESAQQVLRNQKCKVFEDCVIAQEATKKANDVYKFFKMKVPNKVDFPKV
jgi:hypothetical protein